jgi:TonB-linked SusC/RagA family outer membrane protein
MFAIFAENTYAQTVSTTAQRTQAVNNNIELSGVVITDTDKQPATGVTIAVEGTGIGTTTDANGEYRLKVPANTKEVTFSYIGHVTKKISVKDKYSFRLVVLEENMQSLEEVVVVAFGKQKKETLTGAITTVKPTELQVTSSNFSTAFAGKIAGVISTQSSGQPGADAANFWIRGVSTFGSNKSPLLILDGVEIISEMLNFIAPESIESFSILKDATATALYGSRGANGVMIITTKEGTAQDGVSVNVRVQTGVSMPTMIQEIADGVTYMNSYNEALRCNANYVTDLYSADKIENTAAGTDPYIYPNNDWYDLMFKDYTVNQNANISVRGGKKDISYFMNASVFHENGILKDVNMNDFNNNISLWKYAFQSNVSAKITPTTKMGVKMNSLLQYHHRPTEDPNNLFALVKRANPVRYPAMFPAQAGDNFIRYGNNTPWNGGEYDVNPLALENRGYADRYLSYLTTAFNADQDLKFITPGLLARFQVSFYNKTYASTTRAVVPYYFLLNENIPLVVDDAGNEVYNTTHMNPATSSRYLSSSIGRDGYREYSMQGTLEYSRTLAKLHDVNAMIVYHQKEKVKNAISNAENDILPYREQGIAGRFTYAFDHRYLLEANFGYNGSENFPANRRFGFFPALAVGWNISNEAFFSGLADRINLLKMRFSWGKSGEDALGKRFAHITTVNTNQNLYFYYGLDNLVQAKGATIATEGNEDATWEVSEKYNAGLEIGVFNDLTFIVDLFKDYRTGIFMQRRSVPTSLGFANTLPWANIGEVSNRGAEFSLEYNKSFSKDLLVQFRGNFTFAHNEITAQDEPPLLYPNTTRIGHPINAIYGLVADGLFRDWEDINNSTPQTAWGAVQPGDIKYVDVNGDGKIDDNDITCIGNSALPEIVYGFGPSVRWRQFDASFFMQGIAKRQILLTDVHPFVTEGYGGLNMAQWIADDHWSSSNPRVDAAYPRLSTEWNENNTRVSSYYVRNGAFLRMKSAEIGYTYKNVRFYLSGTNLLTFSGFRLWDPEVGDSNSDNNNKGYSNGLTYPLQRTFNLGFSCNF